jgi:hypothetical protein
MKTKIFALLTMLSAFPLFAETEPETPAVVEAVPVIENGVITFDVAVDTVAQFGEPLDGSKYTKLVKKGLGTLVLTKEAINGVSGKVFVDIQEGILRCDVYCGIWGYANVTIADGAQFYANFAKNSPKYSQLVHYFKSIAGNGPDGNGAIRINNTNAKDTSWYSCFRNEVTLSADALIRVDSPTIIGFNTDSTLNLNGHTLTFEGAGSLYFGNEHNRPKNNPKVKAGNIVDNMTGGSLYLKKDVLFEGTGENTIVLGEKITAVSVESLVNKMPWKIVFNSTENSCFKVAGNLRDGVYDPTLNEFSGGFDFNCARFDINPIGDLSDEHPRSITFSGRIRTVRSDGKGSLTGYQDEGENKYLYVHLKAANECNFNFYTGNWYAYADGALNADCDIPMPGNKKEETRPSVVRLYLGEGMCSGAYVSNVASRVSAWTGDFDAIGTLELHTDGDFTINENVNVKVKNVKLKHVGSGNLIFAGKVSNANVIVSDALATVFSGEMATTVAIIRPSSGIPGTVGFSGGIDYARGLSGAKEPGEVSVYRQTGGRVSPSNDSRPTGRFGTGFYGLYDGVMTIAAGLSHGVTLGSESVYVGETESVKAGRSVFQMDGGTLDVHSRIHMCRGGESDFLMRGGKVVFTKDAEDSKPGVYFATDSTGSTNEASQMVFSMTGENAVFDAGTNGAWVSMSSRLHNMHSVIFNLNAGLFKASDFGTTHGTLHSKIYFNFNGGELAFGGRDYIFPRNHTPRMITVYEKGLAVSADFENGEGGRMLYFSSRNLTGDDLLKIKPLTGRGVAKITLPENMPRSGYAGIAPVRVVTADGDETGFGATASLDFDMMKGTVKDELLITCSGCDYTLPPTVIAYGPDMRTGYECEVKLTAEDRKPGAFIKKGKGELVLNAGIYEGEVCNSYPGPYIIKEGTLMVPRACSVPEESEVFVDGGCFRWDWRSRTIAEFGGWGTFFGSRNDQPNTLTVTDRFNADAEDLALGRFLEIDRVVGDDGKTSVGDNVVFGDECVVTIANVAALEQCEGSLALLKQGEFNRIPALEREIEGWRLKLRKGGTELHLVKKTGMSIVVR